MTAKWLSRVFQFENECDGVEIKLSAIFYDKKDIRVYYRPRNVGFTGDLDNNSWIAFNDTGYPDDFDVLEARSPKNVDPSLIGAGDWQEVKWSVQDTAKFDAMQIKIVMTSTNPARPPLIDDMQMIASE